MTRKPVFVVAWFVAVALLAAACDGGARDEAGAADDAPGGGADAFEQPFTDVEAYPLIVNSEITVGKNRMLMGLLDDSDAPIGAPEIALQVSYYDLDSSAEEPVATDTPEFVSIQTGYGVYVGEATFDHAGKWGAEVEIAGKGIAETVRTSFDVKEEPGTPTLGGDVPASDTPTKGDVKELEAITTDPDPDARFYEYSIADALKQDAPFVVTFATPKFCQTAVCGPTLDTVKDVAKGFPKINFVHVEPYELPAEPPEFEIVPSVEEWGLPSEPWVFVVDERGKLAAKFEGVVGAAELEATLRSL